jgi:hypothetical protein
MAQWKPEHESYLRDLSRSAESLSIRFKQQYDHYRLLEGRFQIPAVVISSALGVAAFGNSQFEPETQRILNISMGIVGLCLGIMNSIQSYLKIAQTASGCLLASLLLFKVKERIDREIAVSPEDRANSGIMFLREVATEYEKIIEQAPAVLKRVRFVKPMIAVVASELGESPSVDA